jgi:hypothetical protein
MAKGHTKRPLVVKLATAYFVVAPFIYLVVFSLFHGGSLGAGMSRISDMTWASKAVLAGSWLAALFTWLVSSWSWYALLAYCALGIWQVQNNFEGTTVFPTWAIVTGLILAGSGLLLFLHKEVRSPYLNPRLCWWKTSPRYRVDFSVTVRDPDKKFEHSVNLLDISKTGCFLTTYTNAEVGHYVEIDINHLNCRIEGEVVRTGFAGARATKIEGVGVRFNHCPPEAAKKVKAFVAELAGKVPSRDEPKTLLHLEDRAQLPESTKSPNA